VVGFSVLEVLCLEVVCLCFEEVCLCFDVAACVVVIKALDFVAAISPFLETDVGPVDTTVLLSAYCTLSIHVTPSESDENVVANLTSSNYNVSILVSSSRRSERMPHASLVSSYALKYFGRSRLSTYN
jgi:hypothetical protein